VEVIVASESTDKTNEMFAPSSPGESIDGRGESHGKKAALDRAAASATGEILVFADAKAYGGRSGSAYPISPIQRIVRVSVNCSPTGV